jgi:hypothetical protein
MNPSTVKIEHARDRVVARAAELKGKWYPIADPEGELHSNTVIVSAARFHALLDAVEDLERALKEATE